MSLVDRSWRSVLQNWPLTISLAVFFALVAVWLAMCVVRCEGNLVYALDDAYIHLAIAKNLAAHGTWGIAPGEFSSCASSIAWPLLLAGAFSVLGAQVWVPLVGNLVMAVLLAVVAERVLREYHLPPWWRLIGTLGCVLLAPAVALVFGGMEHLAHAAAAVALLFLASRIIAGEHRSSPHGLDDASALTGLLAGVVTATRFEGMFMVAVIVGLMFWRRRNTAALWTAVCGATPVFLFGLISLSQGWHVLPNSVLLKGGAFELSAAGLWGLCLRTLGRLIVFPHMTLLFVALTIVAVLLHRARLDRPRLHGSLPVAVWIVLASMAAQLVLARFGIRYGAFLVAMSWLVLVVAAHKLWRLDGRLSGHTLLGRPVRWALGTTAVLLVGLLLARAGYAMRRTPLAAGNVYQQQVQLARFVRSYFPGQSVAVNDIGAASFLGNVRCCDLYGLASREVAAARRSGTFGPQVLAQVTKQSGATIAAVYDSWYEPYGGLPQHWQPVGQWRISDNVICGDDVVTFYAISPAAAEQLQASLADFAAEVPSEVEQCGLYVANGNSPRPRSKAPNAVRVARPHKMQRR